LIPAAKKVRLCMFPLHSAIISKKYKLGSQNFSVSCYKGSDFFVKTLRVAGWRDLPCRSRF